MLIHIASWVIKGYNKQIRQVTITGNSKVEKPGKLHQEMMGTVSVDDVVAWLSA